MKLVSIITAFLILTTLSVSAQGTYKPAERVYNRTSDYVKGFFDGDTPPKATIWVIGELRDNINEVLNGVEGTPVRYRYWRKDKRTLWVLESVARTMPITSGVVVEDGKIVDVSVLTYRESRGHEIQNRLHRAQFPGAAITGGTKLDKPINGISGSTLSVNSLNRMARIALLLHNDVMDDG